MHWTLILISIAVAGLFSALLMQWKLGDGVRVIGLLIGSAWAIQQGYFWATGDELPKALFLVCDAFIVAYLFRAQSHWTDRTILGVYAAMFGLYAIEIQDFVLWWLLYWGTFAQIVLALPWVFFATIAKNSRFGPVKE